MKMKYIIPFLVVLLAVLVAIGLYATSPKTKKTIPKRPVPVVETVPVHPARERVFIEAFGTVVPAKRITLQSEVEGRIIDQNPELIPGGLIDQGETVIQVDPTDYELVVDEYRAEMEEAKFELEVEQGKQVIAGEEWKLLGEEVETSTLGKSLALREPHLRLVEAKLEKAKSKLAAAELALKRTTIRSPFNALVLEEFIDKGQLISKATPLATLVGADQFWVQVSIPVASLERIEFSGGPGNPGSQARVIFESINGKSVVREGRVLRILGDLDPQGRMARLLVVIHDPLNLHGPVQGNKGKGEEGGAARGARTSMGEGRVLLESYVKVKIDGGFFDDVYTIPRQALREGDVVWIQDGSGKLQIRNVRVVWRRVDEVLVQGGLAPGDRLILSRLQSPLPGMDVKNAGDQDTPADSGAAGGKK